MTTECPNCKEKGHVVQTREDQCVCSTCGLVVHEDEVIFSSEWVPQKTDRPASSVPPKKRKYRDLGGCKELHEYERELEKRAKLGSTYKRIFHFNERLTQLNMCEPPMPLELFGLLAGTYKELYEQKRIGTPDELDKKAVSKLCCSIELDEEYKEKYRSKKFKQNPHNDMKRYREKWISIRAFLGGYKPPKLTAEQLFEIRRLFMQIEAPFQEIRHVPSCDRKDKKCHLSKGCRYTMLNYNYILVQLLNFMGLYETYAPWLPQLSTPRKVASLNWYWKKICEKLNWQYTEIIVVKNKDHHGWRNRKLMKMTDEDFQKGKEHPVLVIRDTPMKPGDDIPEKDQLEKVNSWLTTLETLRLLKEDCIKDKDKKE